MTLPRRAAGYICLAPLLLLAMAACGGDDSSACSKGSTTGDEVVMIGDSYPARTGDITTRLHELAHSAGALAQGQSYRTYYVSGTQMVGGSFPNIPDQYDQAKQANSDIKVVLMDGGGNDVLIGERSCLSTPPPGNTVCKTAIDGVLASANQLVSKMAKDGVQHIVYYFYPHLPDRIGAGTNATLDYAVPLVRDACEKNGDGRCHFVDSRAAFEGHPEYIGDDGIHPTTEGSNVLAGLIWDTMKANCIAQ